MNVKEIILYVLVFCFIGAVIYLGFNSPGAGVLARKVDSLQSELAGLRGETARLSEGLGNIERGVGGAIDTGNAIASTAGRIADGIAKAQEASDGVGSAGIELGKRLDEFEKWIGEN